MFGWRKHVEIVRVRPGDVIVYQHPKRVSMAMVDAVTENLKQLFPHNQVGVLDDGAILKVVRPTASTQAPERE